MSALAGLLAAFVFGMRHGIDPDHLAAIDNLTRGALDVRRRGASLTGAWFACGHTLMMLALAGGATLFGASVGVQRAFVERAGSVVAVTMLGLFALGNLVSFARGTAPRTHAHPHVADSVRLALLPGALRRARHPLAVVLVGMIFGLGFETATQLATIATAATIGAGVLGALVVGLVFGAGMFSTDCADSWFVARCVGSTGVALPRLRRIWIATMTLFALAVAADDALELFGRVKPVADGTLIAGMLATLCVLACMVAIVTRRERRALREAA